MPPQSNSGPDYQFSEDVEKSFLVGQFLEEKSIEL
jgi:hypothetical protein